jgi:hypothetical protein
MIEGRLSRLSASVGSVDAKVRTLTALAIFRIIKEKDVQ